MHPQDEAEDAILKVSQAARLGTSSWLSISPSPQSPRLICCTAQMLQCASSKLHHKDVTAKSSHPGEEPTASCGIGQVGGRWVSVSGHLSALLQNCALLFTHGAAHLSRKLIGKPNYLMKHSEGLQEISPINNIRIFSVYRNLFVCH